MSWTPATRWSPLRGRCRRRCAGCCCAVSGPGRQHSHARVTFMHVALFECIACVRAHRPRRASAAAATRAAVRGQRELRRPRGRGCDECDAEHPDFCMVLRCARAGHAARGGCVVFPAVDMLALRLARLRPRRRAPSPSRGPCDPFHRPNTRFPCVATAAGVCGCAAPLLNPWSHLYSQGVRALTLPLARHRRCVDPPDGVRADLAPGQASDVRAPACQGPAACRL
jgi:hypothetical protein